MIDGLWTVEFEGVPNFLGGGIIVLSKNHLYGGDSQYFYTGLYDVKESHITAMVQVSAFVPAPESIFGTREERFSIQLSGEVGERHMKGKGVRADNPSMQIQLTLKKRAELP